MNRKALEDLIQVCKSDSELLEIIEDALRSFEEYHTAIYSMEIRKRMLSGTVEVQQVQEEVGNMDQQRTSRHDAVIANISVLNRLAEQSGLPPVYDGVISRDQPYRRQIADAVLNYVRDIILERP